MFSWSLSGGVKGGTTKTFIKDDNERLFQFWATVEIRDKEDELIPLETILPQMDAFMERGGNINLNHTNWTVGELVDYEQRRNEEANADGLYCLGRIFKLAPIDDEVWEAIKKSETNPDGDDILNKVSLAGQFEINENGDATWGAPMEISVTGPAVESEAINPAATIEGVSRAKSRACKSRKGDTVKKAGTEIDEKINEKKAGSEIDEKINEKKADADADALKLKDDAEAESESEAYKKADADSDSRKSDAESEAESESEAQKKSDADSEAMKLKDDAEGDEGLRSVIANLNERLSRIEEMLDKLLEEEEGEHTTDTAIQRAEQKPGTGASAPPTIPDAVAKMSKELAELKAQFAKYEGQGIKKTVQSGSAGSKDNDPTVAEVKAILGSI